MSIQPLRYNHRMPNQKECFSFLEYIGCNVERSDNEGAILSLNIGKEHLQHMGYIHGGVISTLADNTGWFVLEPHLQKEQTAMTQELTVNYLYPGKGKRLTAVGELVKIGKRSAFINVKLYCDEKLIATSTSHLAILEIKE